MVVLIAITVLGRRVCRPRCIDLVVDDPIEHDYTKNPSLDERKLSVLVLYSTQTPAEEARRINELLVCGLGKYNVAVESPDTVGPQQLQKEWIEEGLRERAAVLLVCNRQFQEEWRSNGEGELQVASVVKVSKLMVCLVNMGIEIEANFHLTLSTVMWMALVLRHCTHT